MYIIAIFFHAFMKQMLLEITKIHEEDILATPTFFLRSEQPKNHNSSFIYNIL